MIRSTALRTAARASAVLVLLLAGLAGCGGGESPSTEETASTSPTAASSTATQQPGEQSSFASPQQPGEISPAEFGQVLRTALDKATTARTSLSIGGQAAYQASGAIDMTGSSPATRMTMSLGGKTMVVVLVDKVLYLKGLAPGGKYVKIDLGDPSNPLGAQFANQLDLQAQFKVFERALTRAEFVGNEGGLDRYRASLDPQVLLQSTPLPAGVPTPVLPPQLTFDMFFDADGLIRRISGDMGALGGQFQAEYTDWGTPVSVTAPPASQILQQPSS